MSKHCPTCTCGDLSDPAENTVGGVRRTDPETSAAAAYDVLPRTGTQRMRVLEFLVAQGDQGATDDETMTALAMEPSSAQTRRNELMKGGWVYDTGQVRPTHTGQDAIVWAVTPDGRSRFNGSVEVPPPREKTLVVKRRKVTRRALPQPVAVAENLKVRRPRSTPSGRGAQSKETAPRQPRPALTQEELEAKIEARHQAALRAVEERKSGSRR